MLARSPATAVAIERPGYALPFTERLLNFTLFVTAAASSIAFVEPSPYDAMMFVLLMTCVTARISFDRKLSPLFMLLIVWVLGGALSLIQVGDDPKAVQYFATSIYMAVAAVIFGCLFSDGNARRLSLLYRGYLIAALIATAAGIIGFFHLVPGSDIFLAYAADGPTGRISATFKDPNVYGPFLVFPMLMLMLRFLTRDVSLKSLAAAMALLVGLLLSFSRGAWIHFAVSAAVAIALAYMTAPDVRKQTRIVAFVLAAAFAIALVLIALMSVESVREMFFERAKAIQPYDVGPGGRFTLQLLALSTILDNPNGVGPLAFSNALGSQQHNVYLQGFLVYGWIGGAAYLAFVAITLLVGLRFVRFPTPWQPYLICAFAAYVGEAGEGFIIDSDHWRHFFLLVGMIWGLSIATINYYRRSGAAAPAVA